MSEEHNLATEYEYCEEDVVIDPYNCDLNLVVDKECLLAYPLTNDGFCSMWAGCFATYGVSSKRVAFEVFLNDFIESEDLPKEDQDNYGIRIGWSVKGSSMQLGEDKQSYCYANNGRKIKNSVFEDYGQTFEKGDSVASYIDFETNEKTILVSFSKNGYDLGLAYEIDKDELLNDCEQSRLPVFFPHVLSKNVVFEMNFGQRVSLLGDEPFAPIKQDYELIQKLPLDARVRGEIAPKNKQDCEVIMFVGLPLSGKTQFALDYCKKHTNKCFNIIGVSTIIDKMKMLGSKKKPQANQTVSLSSTQTALMKLNSESLDKAIHCMNKLIKMASTVNRNIILDQV